MPTTLSLALARTIKEEDGAEYAPPSAVSISDAATWFAVPDDGTHARYVSYESIAWHAEEEYLTWRSVCDERIVHTCNLKSGLERWVREHTVEEIAAVMDRVPSGLSADPITGVAFDLCGWQRLSAAHWARHLVTVTARVEITTEHLRDLADYGADEMRRARRMPITSEMTMLADSCPDKFICDLGTAGGKTCWSLAASLSKLLGAEFDHLRREYVQKSAGTFLRGPPTPKIARLLLVAAAGATFRHFVDTARRMAPRAASVDPSARIVVWDTMGKDRSTTFAQALPPTAVVVWVVPVERVLEVLRHDPSVTVPIVVTDEFTVKTPRERSATDQSYVLKHLITQATPQALCAATRGNRSWLREEFGGPLHAPHSLARWVRERQWARAHLVAEQITKFDLMTLTPFRALVRRELRPLVPPGIAVAFVPSRRVTLASHVMETASDTVPANFSNVLLAQLASFRPTPESRERLAEALGAGALDVPRLVAVLDACASCLGDAAPRGAVERLKNRLSEFHAECPVCRSERMTDPRLFGCCGYCVCAACFRVCSRRCPFCRTEVPRAEAAAARASEFAHRRAEPDQYPEASEADAVLVPAALRHNVGVTNLTHAMHHLARRGCRRLLVLVERPRFVERDLASHVDLARLSSVTGFAVARVDDLPAGKATAFARVKRDFDSPNPSLMALLCYGIVEDFVVGTDLAFVDGIVVVGTVPHAILTQAVARTLRPNVLRDNARAIPQINVYVC